MPKKRRPLAYGEWPCKQGGVHFDVGSIRRRGMFSKARTEEINHSIGLKLVCDRHAIYRVHECYLAINQSLVGLPYKQVRLAHAHMGLS